MENSNSPDVSDSGYGTNCNGGFLAEAVFDVPSTESADSAPNGTGGSTGTKKERSPLWMAVSVFPARNYPTVPALATGAPRR